MYITKKTIETDVVTGLEKDIRVISVNIDAIDKIITVIYTINLVSPTGVVMQELLKDKFIRYNGQTKSRYNDLEASPLGLGIIGMLNTDLDTYPNFIQE